MNYKKMATEICTRCVMDNLNDPFISFALDGTCNYCNDALKAKDSVYFPNEEGQKKLDAMFRKIREDGKGRDYDCMMGLSGGLDSSYVALLGHRFGLRILLLHVDDGFDAPVSKSNVEKISAGFNFDLITEKPSDSEFNDLTRAFILAGVPDIAIPQDNILLATLYQTAVKHKIKYLLSGFNFSLECITQAGMDASDKVHIAHIHKKFGRIPLDGKLPMVSILDKRLRYRIIHQLQSLKPLFYVDYNAGNALQELKASCGFEYYGNKHCENTFTKFVQVYYLPRKFGIDKRKSHYSSMIVSGQMTREHALEKLSEPFYVETEMEEELSFILGKLEISRSDFERIMKEEPRNHSEYRISVLNRAVNKVLEIRKKVYGY